MGFASSFVAPTTVWRCFFRTRGFVFYFFAVAVETATKSRADDDIFFFCVFFRLHKVIDLAIFCFCLEVERGGLVLVCVRGSVFFLFLVCSWKTKGDVHRRK